MDVYRKLSESLDPIGEPLFVDRFAALVAEAAERKSREAAAEQARLAAEREAARAAARKQEEAAARPAPRAEAPAAGAVDEVEAFMTRDAIEGADETEIEEFLRERRGFDSDRAGLTTQRPPTGSRPSPPIGGSSPSSR